jgi:hypothetical protein
MVTRFPDYRPDRIILLAFFPDIIAFKTPGPGYVQWPAM